MVDIIISVLIVLIVGLPIAHAIDKQKQLEEVEDEES